VHRIRARDGVKHNQRAVNRESLESRQQKRPGG